VDAVELEREAALKVISWPGDHLPERFERSIPVAGLFLAQCAWVNCHLNLRHETTPEDLRKAEAAAEEQLRLTTLVRSGDPPSPDVRASVMDVVRRHFKAWSDSNRTV